MTIDTKELRDLAEAARKLVKAKGRFHTEKNYTALVSALAAYDAYAEQQADDEAGDVPPWEERTNETTPSAMMMAMEQEIADLRRRLFKATGSKP